MPHGYVRISTEEQSLARQCVALVAAGFDRVVEEIESGVKARRRLDHLLTDLHAGDKLIVSELDRLGRSFGEAVLLSDQLIRREVKLAKPSLPSLDIGPNDGRLIADILASLAAHDRRCLGDRRSQGIARATGRHLNRRPKMNGQQIREGRARLVVHAALSVVARAYGVTIKTLRATLPRTSPAGA